MLIFIGGFVGSGREALGRALAEKLGFAYLSTTDAYGYEALLAAHRQTHPKRSPFDDGELMLLHEDLAKRIPHLVTMRGGIVVCAGLHRKRPRDVLFDAAKRLGEVRVIAVESSDEVADQRMRMLADDPNASTGFAALAALRAVMQATAEPFDKPVILYTNDLRGDEAVSTFLDFYAKSFLRS